MRASNPKPYPKVLARYEGAAAPLMIVGLATGIKYGRRKRGDTLYIHENDIAAQPTLWTVLDAQPSPSAASSLPKTPDELRTIPPPPIVKQQAANGAAISTLGLSSRAGKALEDYGIQTVVEARREFDKYKGFQHIPGVGKATNMEIIAAIGFSQESDRR